MYLNELDQYDSITIQAHDNPDADAIASGYALYVYFQAKGKNVSLIYSGRYRIQKTNLKLMIDKLGIPIEYRQMQAGPVSGLLITVDCQYGAGNVYPFAADAIAVIDHHQKEIHTSKLVSWEIASNLGSCSTLVWRMLLDANYPVNEDIRLGTALYYGLYRDTNQFSEICYPLDMDMRDSVHYDRYIIQHLRNSNMSLKELEIAGIAMIRYIYNSDYHYAIIQAQPCDPNLLGLISDFLIQVDELTTCVVFNQLEDGYKFSVRSCVKEVRASELAQFLAADMGSGGGHVEKAGGFIARRQYEEKYPTLHSEGYFSNRMNEYFDSFDILYAEKMNIDTSDMKSYYIRPAVSGYVEARTLMPIGTKGVIRTLEGDIELEAAEDMMILVNEDGRVKVISNHEFEEKYKVLGEHCNLNLEYKPRLRKLTSQTTVSIMRHMNSCTSKDRIQVYARQLERGIKVFSNNIDSYMVGRAGDYLVVTCDEPQNIYMVEKILFDKNYQVID